MISRHPHVDHAARTSTAWAAGTLKNLGCTLYAVDHGGWDIETPFGWRAAENWRELCDVAQEIQSLKRVEG